LFAFEISDVLKYDLADVRLPGAVVDPYSGRKRLAAPFSSTASKASKSHAKSFVSVSNSTSAESDPSVRHIEDSVSTNFSEGSLASI
jgi:hypothetical protein